jgi:glycosyltransferase involved in cell wall biosynthesis
MTLVSVQPFGIQAPGGGARILRAVFGERPQDAVNVCTATRTPPPADPFGERHLPLRPDLGRIESTRLNRALLPVDLALGSRFARELRELCNEVDASAVHGVAHSVDFIYAARVAQQLGVPFVLSVHDDLAYNFRGRLGRAVALRQLERVWRAADRRFVISEPLGEEYSKRYGAREYQVVTDGVTEIHEARDSAGEALRIYFAGLFHLSYRENFDALIEAAKLRRAQGRDVELTCRCGTLEQRYLQHGDLVTVLPFADEQAVANDLERASLLYLPLPFDSEHEDLVRFSLSTKLVTYLASGIPILYHGPSYGAAYSILSEHEAAIIASSPEPAGVADAIASGLPQARRIVANAQTLASERFMLERQREVFWNGLRAEARQVRG